MTAFSMAVPYMRTSPLYVQRRDLVLTAADSLSLQVAVIDRDSPYGVPIGLSTGIGTPAAQFTVWVDQPGQYYYEYGTSHPLTGQVLWTSVGTVADPTTGVFAFSFPSGTMMTWPRRCAWGVQLNHDATGADMLISGRLHIRYGGAAFALPPTLLETDGYIPITTDTLEQVLA